MNWLSNVDIWARYVWAVHSASSQKGQGQRKILSVQEDLLDEDMTIGAMDNNMEEVVIENATVSECELSVACNKDNSKELEMEEELRQKEDPVFQSLVIPT
jgi:hypothetical protein